MNFAIPSAGGEWAVIGPYLLEVLNSLGENLSPQELQSHMARLGLSVAYGESLTNLLQPFFLLIILPVMGVGVKIQARDVMVYLIIPFFFFAFFASMFVSFFLL